MSIKILIYEPDEQARTALQQILTGADLMQHCRVLSTENQGNLTVQVEGQKAPRQNDIFEKPVRIGAVLQRIHHHLHTNKTAEKPLKIGPFLLNPIRAELYREGHDNTPIRLTEKETHILKYLSAHKDRIVERAELLREIWGYAQNVETHTLETHIYRLRQKMEEDPANPDILLTTDQGYQLRV